MPATGKYWDPGTRPDAFSDLDAPEFIWRDHPNMNINDDHLYHGAALTQIAEHPSFTSINAFASGGERSRCSFLVNDELGLYIKYATKPTTSPGEYKFGFTRDSLAELRALTMKRARVCVALVCVKAKVICALTAAEVLTLVAQRLKARGSDEAQYDILVMLSDKKQARVYTNVPGEKMKTLGRILVPRNRFPALLFEE